MQVTPPVRSRRARRGYVLLAVGLLATVAVTVVVTRAARRALESRTELVDEG